MRFEIDIKNGPGGSNMKLVGRERPNSLLTVEDLEQVPFVEAFLERLTTFRFHIQQAPPEAVEGATVDGPAAKSAELRTADEKEPS